MAAFGQKNSDLTDSIRYRFGLWKTILFHAWTRMDTPMDPIGRIFEQMRDTGRPIGKIGVPIGFPETVSE